MRILYAPLLFLFISTTGFSQTCSLDNQYAGAAPGIYPATALAPGCDLMAAKTIVGLTDTVVPNPIGGGVIQVFIDAIRVNEVQGLPAGITFETDVMGSADGNSPYGIWFNSGTPPFQDPALGCAFGYGTGGQWDALIGGGPNNDGVYPLDFIVDARIAGSIPDISIIVPNGSWLSDNAGLTGGAFTISQAIMVLPGYDTLNAVIAGETNVAPNTGYAYSVGNDPNVAYNWSVTNGSVTSGQGTSSVMIEWNGAPTGNVQVELTDGGCYGITDLDVTSTSIGIMSRNIDFRVFPNPTTGSVNLELAGSTGSVKVSDASGRVFLSSPVSRQKTLNLTAFPAGLYLVSVETAIGVGRTVVVKR